MKPADLCRMILCLVLPFAGCQSEEQGATPETPAANATTMINEVPLEDCSTHGCSNGCVQIDYGVDEDANGTLDGDEVDGTAYVCHGQDGEDGLPGADGQDGAQGEPGTDGQDGAQGQPGADGQDGAQGEPGADGQDGANGENGQNGSDGEDGSDCSVSQVDCDVTLSCEDGTSVTWTLPGCSCDLCGVCDSNDENDNDCDTTNLCSPGTTQLGTTTCGPQNEGYLIQNCIDRQWTDTETCDASLPPRSASTIRTGPIKVALVLAYYTELSGPSAIDQNFLTGLFKTQPEAFGAWASLERMDLEVTLFYHPLNVAERDESGACRGHPGKVFDQVEGLVGTDFDVKAFYELTTTGCSGSCAFGGTGATRGVQCTTSYSNLLAVDCDPSSETDLCQSSGIFMHEVLHGLGLQYHQGGVQCTAADIASPDTSWRDCERAEYGGVFDVLGSMSDKASYGVAAKSRYDLGWLNPNQLLAVEKADAIDSWVETTLDVTLVPLDSDAERPGHRAVIISFSDPLLSGLGGLWLEYRAGNGFDGGISTLHSGHNAGGILGFHDGTALIDFSTLGEDVDAHDWYKVSLNPEAGVWRDPASGLELETLSADPNEGATVRITFKAPPACVPAAPSMNLPGYHGGYKTWLAKGDLELYAAPEGEGWREVTIYTSFAEYMPYWFTPELDSYQVVFSHMLSARNRDSATCSASTLSVRGHALPEGWRVDEGACQNEAAGQDTTDVCFSVAVPNAAPHGAYEILIEIFKEEDGMGSELYPLWLCVGGFNPWFMSIANDRVPPWLCTYGDLEEGVEPAPADRGD